MIALARLHLARRLLVLGDVCIRLACRAARLRDTARLLLRASDACASLARQLVTPIAHG
jgi:hypothetical protein